MSMYCTVQDTQRLGMQQRSGTVVELEVWIICDDGGCGRGSTHHGVDGLG